MKRLITATVLAWTLALGACKGTDQVRAVAKAHVVGVDQPATLVHQLGPDAIFYLRLPNLSSGPAAEGRALDAAYSSAAHREVIEKLRARVRELATPMLQGQPGVLNLLLNDLAGPFELAVIAPGGMATPAATVVFRLPLRVDRARLAALLVEGVADAQALKFDAEGQAQLSLDEDLKVALHFDEKHQTLTGKWQMGAPGHLPKQFIGLAPAPSANALADRAAALDPSGLGATMVLSSKAFEPYLGIAATGEKDPFARAVLEELSALETIAIGAGTVDGSGQMSIELDGFSPRLLSYLPAHTTRLDVPVLGTPSSLASMQLPNRGEVLKIAKKAMRLGGQSWSEVETFTNSLGVDPWQIFDVIGPSMHAITDDGGNFLAIELQDPAAFEHYLDQLDTALQRKDSRLQRRVVTARGKDYTWLSLSAAPKNVDADAEGDEEIPGLAKSVADSPEMSQIMAMLSAVNSQRFGIGVYRIEGNWLLLADVPQALYGRSKRSAKLSTWLAKTQRQEFSAAMLAMSSRSDGWARQGYQYYLHALVGLSDFLNVEIPIEAMPSSLELSLPKSGAVGFSVDRLPRGIALRLHYQNSAVELVGGAGGIGAISVSAILAAIALPAYQDYTTRAKVAEVLPYVRAAQLQVEEQTLSEGTIPDELSLVDASDLNSNIGALRFVDQGILLTFSPTASAGLAGESIGFTPCVEDGAIVAWRCGRASCEVGEALIEGSEARTTVLQKYLPQSCR